MKIKPGIAASILLAMSLTACATSSERFEWGAYEPTLYRYTTHPEARENYRTALKNAVEAGRKTNRVAPGLLAELGFLYLQDGDNGAADALFAEEMQRFPESATFLKSLIERRKAQPRASTLGPAFPHSGLGGRSGK